MVPPVPRNPEQAPHRRPGRGGASGVGWRCERRFARRAAPSCPIRSPSVSRGRDLGDNRSFRGLRPHDGLDPENGRRGYPGLSTAVATYPEDRIARVTDDGQPGRDSPGLRGKTLPTLEERAEGHPSGDGWRGRRIRPRPSNSPPQEASLSRSPSTWKLRPSHGVKAGDVRRVATTLLCSVWRSACCLRSRRCSRSSFGASRSSATASPHVEDLLIETPSGDLIRLDDLADVRVAPTPTVISREGVMRIVDVGATVSSRNRSATRRH